MIITFDATTLILLFDEHAKGPADPATGNPLPFVKERLEAFCKTIWRQKGKILVPTPALSEMAVHAEGAISEYFSQLNNNPRFQIAPFDARAAIEAGLTLKAAIKAGDKRSGLGGSWAKIKFDRQIVAISKIRNADEIITDDDGLQKLVAQSGILSKSLADIPIPASAQQPDLFDPEQ